MAINAVAPWEGALDWVGEPNEGQGRNGTWKSVEFTLKYEDHQMNEKFITFSVFGAEKVDKLLAMQKGTMLKVVWWPEANYVERTGKWYPKLSAISIGLAKTEAKPADTKVTAPNYPEHGTTLPKPAEAWKNHMPTPSAEPLPSAQDDSDLPF